VGIESVSDEERVTLEIAKSLREDFLFQNAFDKEDAYTPLKKQYQIVLSIITLYDEAVRALKSGFTYKQFAALEVVKELPALKAIENGDVAAFESFRTRVKDSFISTN
jgi:V/A-type H+-transporting ATPase subunit A